ncbi:MAG: phage virion morphogenesis protein [Thalassobaculales bacterium]
MAGVSYTVTVDDAGVQAALALIAARGQHPGPLLELIGRHLVDSTVERFDREEAPDGTPWPKSRAAVARAGRTLQDSRRLMDSIIHQVSGAVLDVGTNVIYGPPHQFGATIKPKTGEYLHFRLHDGSFRKVRAVTLPPRPFLGLSDHDRAEIPAIAADYLVAPR